ncbi:unnamed protein product [Caenorhabditis bovis]|uniref:Serpentine receptor class r-10 n=1 Tax=Caenorhabditis bovis TaxID=2654633 RepID=A0A8S1E948_9PELO|nr:unnamed protein product [Caenorhabditis bovis]
MRLTVQNLAVHIGFILSCVFNIFLIYMIRKKTSKQLGTYKYLMLSFSMFEMMFSTIDILNQPTIYVNNGVFILFSTNPLHLPRSFATYFNILNFSLFGMIIALLAIHFVYRYFAVCKPKYLVLFETPYYFIFIVIFLCFGAEWFWSTALLGGARDGICDLQLEEIAQIYNIDIKNIVFTGMRYTTAKLGYTSICWNGVVLALILLQIIIISAITVLYCGIRTYFEMSVKRASTSRRTLDMQRQLFRALVVQTIIPVILLYVPMMTIFAAPIFHWKLNFLDAFVLIFIILYQILDPLAILYLVRDYRRAIKHMINIYIIDYMVQVLQGHSLQNSIQPPTPAIFSVHNPGNTMGIIY